MQAKLNRRALVTGAVFTCAAFLSGRPAVASGNIARVVLEPIAMNPSNLTVVAPDGSETTYTQLELEALGAHRMITSTEWHGENVVFEGALLSELLARHGFPTNMAIRVVAENDYGVTFLPDEIASAPVVIATRLNGKPMTRRGRGPFFFAIDADEVANDAGLNGRHLVWFARTIRPASPDEY